MLTINFVGDGLRDALDPRRVMCCMTPWAPLLEIHGLKTHFKTDDGWLHAVDGVDLTIERRRDACASSASRAAARR